jgi:DGQHR domain-containing protein
MALTLDVAEGQQGTTTYYTGSIEWGELLKYAVFPDALAEELKGDEDQDDQERMQRSLASKRIPALVDYLSETDHFFSAVTLILLPTDLDHPAADGNVAGVEEDAADFKFVRAEALQFGRQKRGVLHVGGSIRFFPADGQHRMKAADAAIKQHTANKQHDLSRRLTKEEVPVVIVPYRNADQVRQMFADLNLNAKPVSKTVGLDFDHRDPIVAIARAASQSLPLFKNRVNRSSNSLSKSSANVITMNTLVECTQSLLAGVMKADRVDPNTVKELQAGGRDLESEIVAAWSTLLNPFEALWQPVLDGVEKSAGALRDEYLFPHGIGWQALARALGSLMKTNPDDYAQRYTDAVDAIDWKRTGPWEGTAMVGTRVNNTGPGIAATTKYILQKAE